MKHDRHPRWPRRAAALTAVCACTACPLTPFPAPAEEPLTAAEHGEALFHDPALSPAPFNTYACSTCHVTGSSSPDDLLRPGAPLAGVVNRPSFWGGAEVDLLRAVNHCLKYFMLQDELWTGTEPQAEAIYAFLESLSDGATPSDAAPFTVDRLPVAPPDGDTSRGLSVHRRACRSCHGDVHSGESKLVDFAPTLPEDVLAEHPLGEYSAEEQRLAFVLKVRHGAFLGYTGQMPPFSTEVLSDEDVGDLLALFFAP